MRRPAGLMMSWFPHRGDELSAWPAWLHLRGAEEFAGPAKAGRAGGLFWLTRGLAVQDERCACACDMSVWKRNLECRDWRPTDSRRPPVNDVAATFPPLHPRAAPLSRRTTKAYAGTGCPRSRSRRATQDLSPHSARAASHMQMSVAPGVGRAGGAQPRCARGNLKAVAEGDNEDDNGAVRSEGSGPQSWARSARPADARGGLRRTSFSPQAPSPFCLNQSSILCQACSASALR
ncbi:Uncharacterised protein [Achromobacter xylosoxidans]|nr:Uncharacterised protein [Achromobacter xylosoxidans]